MTWFVLYMFSHITPHWDMLPESRQSSQPEATTLMFSSFNKRRPALRFANFDCWIMVLSKFAPKQQQKSGTFLGQQQRIYLVEAPGCRGRSRAQIQYSAKKKYFASRRKYQATVERNTMRGTQILCNRAAPSGCQGSESNSPVTKFYQVRYLP